eukprot:3368958-Alexandrium_andersonii.AAC.1
MVTSSENWNGIAVVSLVPGLLARSGRHRSGVEWSPKPGGSATMRSTGLCVDPCTKDPVGSLRPPNAVL